MFLVSGFYKIRQPYAFFDSIQAYRVLCPFLAISTAVVLPWLELTVGLALIAGVLIRGALFAIACLALAFVVLQVLAMGRGLEISCGCFAPSGGEHIGILTIARDLLITLSAGIGFLWARPGSAGNGEPAISAS